MQKNNLVSKGILTLNKEQTSHLLKQKQNMSADFYWAELELSGNNLDGSYIERINRIKQIDGVQVVSPYFTGKSEKRIGLSNFFYVKLKALYDTTLLKRYSYENKVIIVKQDKFMPLWFVLSCTKHSEVNAMKMANRFYESQLFQYAEPDLIVNDLLNCTNDIYFSNQWGLRNTGQYGGTTGIDIKACDAWNLSTGTGVTVAVIDQGIELNHPDLQANIHPLSFDTETGTSPSIVQGNHGVAYAGIVGAVGNNSLGIRGVASNVRLMSVSNSLLGTPLSRMARGEGINWAVENGADVLSNSWGSSVQYQIIDDAIANAFINGRNGLGSIVVFASGNDNDAVNYPANSNPNILAVGAMSPCGQRKRSSSNVWEAGPGVSPDPQGVSCDGEKRWGSNYGSQLDVVAPGVLVPTTDRQGNLGYNPNEPIHTGSGGNKITSDYANRDYTVWFNGTSAACPHVAGVAALILSVRPDLTGQQVRDVIEQTAQKVGGYSYTTTQGRPNGTWNQEMGYGLVNAYAAVYSVYPQISGPSVVCAQNAFSIQNLPSGATIQWSADYPLEVFSGQGTGTAMIINEDSTSYNGIPSTVYATITIGSQVINLEKIVQAGTPEFDYFDHDDPYVMDVLDVTAFFSGVDYYTWTKKTGDVSIDVVQGNSSRALISIFSSKLIRITVTAFNSCGSREEDLILSPESYRSSSLLSVYPNPAGSYVVIAFDGIEEQNSTMSVKKTTGNKNSNTDTETGLYTIQLWNSFGLVKTVQTDQGRYHLDLSGIPSGFYYVHVIKDEKVYRKPLKIN